MAAQSRQHSISLQLDNICTITRQLKGVHGTVLINPHRAFTDSNVIIVQYFKTTQDEVDEVKV